MMKEITLNELEPKFRDYLVKLDESTDPNKKAEIPVYVKIGEEAYFVTDYKLRDNKQFEKTAPPNLYRGGASLKLVTKEGQVVIYDERYRWLRLIGGIARFDEGSDLAETAIREAIIEELAVLADGEKVRLVPPQGMSQMIKSTAIDSWRINVPEIRETGIITEITHFFNEANKAFELVVEWDISNENNLIILHSEEWFKGGSTGFIPFVINSEGDVVGMYDGRHGYVSLPISNLHPTLERVLKE